MLTSISSSESPRNWTTIHTSSAHVSLGYACLPPCRGLVIDHGALPYRAARKAVNPRQAGPMLILICGVNPGTRVHAGPLRAQSAYQVSPVYDHPAIFTPLPTNSQAEPSGWQKDLGQIFVHWVGLLSLTAPHSTTYTHLLTVFVSFPIPIPTPIVSKQARTGIASFLSRVLDASNDPTDHQHRDPLEQELFSELDDCGRINPTTCRTNSPGMATPEKAGRGSHSAAGCAPWLQVDKTDIMLPLVSPSSTATRSARLPRYPASNPCEVVGLTIDLPAQQCKPKVRPYMPTPPRTRT